MEHIQTPNKSDWVNTCEYIILHHTWTWPWSKKGLINAVQGQRDVSFHYLIDEHWLVTKIGDHRDILRHAWESQRYWKTWLNSYSIGVEVIWPWFTNQQKRACEMLLSTLMREEDIPKDNVLRHAHISPWRKRDISEEFFNIYWTWEDYQNYLSTLVWLMWFYEELRQKECADIEIWDRVFQYPEKAFERLKELSPDDRLKEMVYLMALLLQRVK